LSLRVEDINDGDTISGNDFARWVDSQDPDAPIPEQIKPGKPKRNYPEREFQQKVQQLARSFGWTDWHVLRSKGMRGGFPDLLLLRSPEIIWVELKAQKGKPTKDQIAMHDMLRECGQQVYLWYPSDLDDGTIVEVLLPNGSNLVS